MLLKSIESDPIDNSSEDVFGDIGGLEVSSGGLIVEELNYPIFSSLDSIDVQLKQQLEDIALVARTKQNIPLNEMQDILILLCQDKYLTLKLLSDLLHRNEDYLRRKLNEMCKNKQLTRAFPKSPNDPRQAYTAT